jgi:5'-nucleotidase (lipoprotein e(P4) family)
MTERSTMVNPHFPRARVSYVFSALALATALAACHAATAKPPASAPASPSVKAQPPALPAARHTHENLNATLWMQTSVEYRATTLQAYHAARVALDAALADPKETAATEQTADASSLPPAVVLDLDETVLDNSAFEARQVSDNSPFSDEAFDKWCLEEKASAIPGAIEFLKYAKSKGVTPIYVTNRNHTTEDATRHVLDKVGAPVETSTDVVLMRHEQGWEASDKGTRRAFVAKSYRILLLVGDNFEDFISVPSAQKTLAGRDAMLQKYVDYWGTRWIVLPNPTYGSWEQAITTGVSPSDDAGVLARKYATLELKR